ncbi:MAG: redox-regulated ATPase YchF [Anaerolineae bacterium]|nr:redox-regulated ATPase YchF [Anaerolineae bacterium]
MQIGIVGLPNVGKSTLFNALTQAGAQVAAYPFTTIDPNVGVVPLRDERLDWLAEHVRPERTVPATVEFVDIAGLVRGAHRGEGLGNQFLHHIRTVDAIALVARAFEDPEIPHVSSTVDPLEDIQVVETELILADMGTVERRLERVRAEAKAKPREHAPQVEFLGRLQQHLDRGEKVRSLPRSEEEQALLDGLFLLTNKPRMYVVNVGEDQLDRVAEVVSPVEERAREEGVPVVAICARLEADLADWTEEEARQYRQELGLSESGLQTVVRVAFDLLGLVTFFTIVGGREVRAWEIKRGTSVVRAAGRIHSDMERGFIRAEVIAFEDLRAAGSVAAARERGLLRAEGRDYPVQDGDVIQIRFSA